MRRRPIALLGLLVALWAASEGRLQGQLPVPPAPVGTPPEELPSFEVASVKKVQSTSMSGYMVRLSGGGRMMLPPVPLRTLLTLSWGIRADQIVGEPAWSATDRFTINARAEDNAPQDQLLLMLRSLLVERFQLRYHAEQREQTIYVLTASPDWEPSDRMRPIDCTAAASAPPPATPAAAMQRCGSLSSGTNGIRATGLTMASFASLLGSLGGLGQVQDRTGLEGTYSFELDSSLLLGRSSALISALGSGGSVSSNTALRADLLPSLGEGPSLGSAIEELGLKLDRRKEQIDVLVIDSVSQPDPD